MPLPLHPVLSDMATPPLFTPANQTRECHFRPQPRIPVELARMHASQLSQPQYVPQMMVPQHHDYYRPRVNLSYVHPSYEPQFLPAPRDRDMTEPGIYHEYNHSIPAPQHVEQIVISSRYSSYGLMFNTSQTESATHAQALQPPCNPNYPMELQNPHSLGELIQYLPDLYRRYGVDINVPEQENADGYWDHKRAPGAPHTSQPVQTHSSIPEAHTLAAPYNQNLSFSNDSRQFPSQGETNIVPQQENAIGYCSHQQMPASPHISQPVQTHSSTPETHGQGYPSAYQ